MAKKYDIEKEASNTEKEIEAAEKKVANFDKVDKTSEEYLMQKVPVRLIKDKHNTTDAIVRVNGYAFQIQRGVTVLVPRYIKEVIDHKELQEQEALERSQELQINPNDFAFK